MSSTDPSLSCELAELTRLIRHTCPEFVNVRKRAVKQVAVEIVWRRHHTAVSNKTI